MEAQSATAPADVDTTGVEEPSSNVTGRVEPLGETNMPSAASTDGYAEVALSTDSERQGCPSEDTEFSSDEDSSAGEFTSRREFLCFGYLFSRARVTFRQYDVMREAENSFNPKEKWPSRSRLRRLRKLLLKLAVPLRREVTTRQLPVVKGKALRKLPDVTVSYIPFSEHIKRDFGAPVTAALFHNKGGSGAGTVERPAEFFQTVAARDPARFSFKNAFFRAGYRYDIGCVVQISFDSTTSLQARLESTAIAPDGDVTISESTYARQSTLRVGDMIALFEVLPGVEPPENWASCFTADRRLTLRFNRSGGVFVIDVRGLDELEKDSWSAVTAPQPLELSQVDEQTNDALPEKDPYTLYVSLYGDEFNVYKRRRGSLEGYYGGYTSLSLEDRAFSVRSLFYLPPGANSDALIRRVVDDAPPMSSEGVAVYDAFKRKNAVVRVYLCLGVFDLPMAATFSNSVGPRGTEHCTSCDIVHPKTTSERRERAMSSTVSVDVQDARYCRVQERTAVIMSTAKGSPDLSADALKEALLLNGITEKSGTLLMRLEQARGEGSFDIHSHVIVAPSHLLYYDIGANLLMEAYEALSVEQRDRFMREMRRSAKQIPTHTVLSSLKPEKMGGTTLSMSDYAVLLTVGPTVLQYLVQTDATTPHALAALSALKALRTFSIVFFYRPTLTSDGEQAMRGRPTVAALQVLGEQLMMELRRLVPFEGSWERPAVHSLLELLYRTLPLVQLGPAVCELIFETFHQLAKQEVSQSNSRNPAEFSMQRWRDTEHFSRLLSMPDEYGIPASWLLGRSGQPLKAVQFHRLAPHGRPSSAVDVNWRPKKALHAVRSSTEELWRHQDLKAVLAFYGKATHPHRSFVIREGSTISVPKEREGSSEEPSSEATDSDAQLFARVHSIGTIDGELHVAVEKWKLPPMALSILGQPVLVAIDVAAGVTITRAHRVRQIAFVLPCGQHDDMFSKRSGFHFKSG